MPEANPITPFTLAVNFFVVISQILLVIYGPRFSYTQRLMPGLFGSALIMIVIPFACLLSSPANFWVVFLLLLIFGALSGII